MFKKKGLVKCTILLMIIFSLLAYLPINKSYASGPITGNNSFGTAHNFGHWKYKSGMTILDANETEAYYSVQVDSGERIFADLTYKYEYVGMKIEIFDEAGKFVSIGDNPVKPGYYPFIFAKCDGTKIREKFYVKVSRGSYTGDMFYTVSFEDRIKTDHKTFNFPGTAVNPGNVSFSNNGVDSNVLRLNLREDKSIPKEAVVTSVETVSNQTPSQGHVHHLIMCAKDGNWQNSRVSSSNKGYYYISVDDKLKVADVWNFKYNAKASGPSKMTNVKMKVNYEYDITYTY